MNTAILIALSVFLLSILVRVVAFPGEVDAISQKPGSLIYLLVLHLLSFLMYASWVVYGYYKEDMIMMAAQGTGLLTSVIFTGHIFFRYRKK